MSKDRMRGTPCSGGSAWPLPPLPVASVWSGSLRVASSWAMAVACRSAPGSEPHVAQRRRSSLATAHALKSMALFMHLPAHITARMAAHSQRNSHLDARTFTTSAYLL
eukprot:2005293-Rhodomonas_salina.4